MINKESIFMWKLTTIFLLMLMIFFTTGPALAAPSTQAIDTNPPDHPVKLIFIHHSCGENWLNDDNGGLGQELGRNNYFVSDTNYGWGPDGIGDRTDIPNWLEWFRAQETERYMSALFNESGQNSSYTRTLADPAGENQIIMFKSCFPNSNLDGNPNDPPSPGTDLTVSNAKYIYNELLKYFITRPDKLFIVITAPPVQDPAYSTNARAFNTWLVQDWLRENNYPYSNVAVFDFYNVLTGRNNHHRVQNGAIEYITNQERDTAFYPTEDDHPSATGNRKATEEYAPLLNVYYHRWQSNTPSQPLVATVALPAVENTLQPNVQPAVAGSGSIDNFEGTSPVGTSGWEIYWDETTPTTVSCEPESGTAYSGAASQRLEFNVAANSWATCTLNYDPPQNWSGSNGLTFYLRAIRFTLVFNVDLYTGPTGERETYLYTIETPPDSANGWIPIELAWNEFHRADWEENGGEPFNKPDQVSGIGFGFSTYPDTTNTGTIWVDDLRLMGNEPIPPIAPQEQPRNEDGSQRRRLLPCGSAIALPAAVVGLLWLRKSRRYIQ
jgi:hypothetical protein